MQKGWVWDGAWYYLDSDFGFMYSDGLFTINGNLYCLKPDGAMVTGWYFYDYDPTDEWRGNWFYFNEDGTPYDGWLLDGGWWYYIQEGYMMNNTTFSPGLSTGTGDETTWVFDASGHLIYGGWHWHEFEDGYGFWSLSNADGTGYTGWIWENYHWYYISRGYMVHNATFTAPDGYTYAFDGNGYLATSGGWLWLGDSEYDAWTYTDENGIVLTNDWKWIDGKWYYFDEYGYIHEWNICY